MQINIRQNGFKSLSRKELFQLKTLLAAVLEHEYNPLPTQVVLSYHLMSDKQLLRLNRQYLNHDYYTDILTFDLSEFPNELISDIFISVDRVKDNSKTLNAPFKQELKRVFIHGALHLCGYSDKTKSEQRAMRSKEDYYLSLRP